MGSHSVTCHPTQVNAPRLNPNHAGRWLTTIDVIVKNTDKKKYAKAGMQWTRVLQWTWPHLERMQGVDDVRASLVGHLLKLSSPICYLWAIRSYFCNKESSYIHFSFQVVKSSCNYFLSSTHVVSHVTICLSWLITPLRSSHLTSVTITTLTIHHSSILRLQPQNSFPLFSNPTLNGY